MTRDTAELIETWDGLAVVSRYDASTESWIFIALHDDTLGRPTGGTRMRRYASPAEGLEDAMRLARGMTYKWASIGLDVGGGKAVLALSRPLAADEREGLLRRYGRLVGSLHGSFATGEDLGTTPEDMQLLAEETRHVHVGEGPLRDPGPFTAEGVLAGMRSAVKVVFGGELAGRSVLIQGAGDVGAPLARACAQSGAKVILADLDEARALRLAGEIGAELVHADEVYGARCDVYAPCATGATVNSETIPRLACRIVAGSANNQLEHDEDAERLHARGILYAPDYVINAGGALAFGLHARGEKDPEVLRSRVRSIGGTLSEIFAEANERGESPHRAAERRAERALQSGRRS